MESLFIIKEKTSGLHKYMGFGKIVEKFENEQVLARDIEKKGRKYEGEKLLQRKKARKDNEALEEEEMQVDEEVQSLTPGKYKFSVSVGHGEDEATKQKIFS